MSLIKFDLPNKMLQSKLRNLVSIVLSVLGIILRAAIITLLLFVLIESSLHYRRLQQTSIRLPKPVSLQYDFTNNEGERNVLVVMS